MAIDPNTTAPLAPIPTIRQPDVGPTPNSIAMQREWAKLLMQKQQSKNPFYTWANGLNDAGGDILGAMQLKKADEREKELYAGGRRAATEEAAPGGAAPAGPFPQAPRQSALGSDPSSMSSLKPQGDSTKVASLDPSSAAMALSRKGETGKEGIAALFNISGDTNNSKSYGPLGLNSKSGSVRSFSKDNPNLELTAEPGTPEFDAQWRRAAALNSGEDMRKAHEDWHQKNIMKGLPESMVKAGVDPKIANDPRVQTYMADRKVQMGQAGLNTALAYASGAPTAESFIHAVSQVDKSRIPNNFPSYLRDHPNDVKGLANRIDLRHNTALSGADPELAANMIDYHRTKGAVGEQLAQNGPPTALAQNRTTYPRIPYSDPDDVAANRGQPTPPGPPPTRGGYTPFPKGILSSPPPAPGRPTPNALPQGQLQQEYRNAINGFITAGYPPDVAMEMAKGIMSVRAGSKAMETGLMPQYQVDEYGQVFQTAPGQLPQLAPGLLPGHFGSFKEEPGLAGAGIRSTVVTDPVTGARTIRRQYEKPLPPAPPGPSSSATPAPVTPPPRVTGTGVAPVPGGGPVVTAPPVAPPSAPGSTPAPTGGILAAPPPGATAPATSVADEGSPIEAAKGKLAMAGVPPQELMAEVANQAMNKPSKLDVIAQAEKAPDFDKPITSEEKSAKEALDWAEAHPTNPQMMPNLLDPALSGGISDLYNLPSNKKINEDTLTDAIKEEKKDFGKFQTQFRDAASQSSKLRPGLKTAIALLDSPDFQSGPVAGGVTQLRGLREELGRLTKGWADDAVKAGADPGIYKTISDWALDPNNRTATANQIYQKILQGTILQSLRGMLGPNAGQFRVQELKMLEQAFGNPNLTLDANKAVMSMVDKTNDRNILMGQMASEYARKHHGLDPSFEQAMQRFEIEHPAYTPQEYAKTLRLVNSSGPPVPDAAGGGPINTTPPAGGPSGLPSPEEIQRERERRRAK